MEHDLIALGYCSISTAEGWLLGKEVGKLMEIIHDVAAFLVAS